jgi:hypothetical protein
VRALCVVEVDRLGHSLLEIMLGAKEAVQSLFAFQGADQPLSVGVVIDMTYLAHVGLQAIGG